MRRTSRRGAVVATAVAALVAVALPAAAYYLLSSNSTTATATARTLGTPGTGTPAVTTGSVSFAVSAPAAGPTPTGYRVDRSAPTAVTGVCSLGAGAGTCTDSSPVGGQTNIYVVYALLGNWQSPSPATVTANVPAASFVLTASTATPVAGTAFTVTITARSGGTTDTSYAGSKTLAWSGGQSIGTHAPSYQSAVTFTNGVGTASVTLPKAGAQTLTATAGAYSGSVSVTVSAGTPRLAFSTCPATHPRNSSFTTTVTRTGTDEFGNPTGTGLVTVTLSPSTGSAKFTTATTTIANGALASPTVTYNTANTAGVTATLTAAATGYTSATCSTTTS